MLQGASLWGGLATGGISQLQDTAALQKGQISKNEYAVQTTENVTGAIGVMAGIEYGAIWGSSVMPGVGTIVGGVIGALLGDRLGRTVGHSTGSALFNKGGIMSNMMQMNQNNAANEQNAANAQNGANQQSGMTQHSPTTH